MILPQAPRILSAALILLLSLVHNVLFVCDFLILVYGMQLKVSLFKLNIF